MSGELTGRRCRRRCNIVFGMMTLAASALATTAPAAPDGSSAEVHVDARVVWPDGRPASGAVVVTVDGESTVTDAHGRASILVRCDDGAATIGFTAIASSDGRNYVARVRRDCAALESETPLSIRLAESTTCSPEWLPSFGTAPGFDATPDCYAVFDDGSGRGPQLYVGGYFQAVCGVAAPFIARWDGKTWSSVGGGFNNFVHSLVVFDDGLGGGPALYAGGEFTLAGGLAANRVARWNGAAWSALGSGVNDWVFGLAVFDPPGPIGPGLYVGGFFTTAGGVSANRMARWNGVNWSSLGTGLNDAAFSIVVHDDGLGGGPALYAAGGFTSAGGMTAARVAKWNGTAWSKLGNGVNNTVNVIAVHDDGTGAKLYAGGLFTTAGGLSASRIARWNGAAWSALGPGLNDIVDDIESFDDGTGPALYATGSFTKSGTANMPYIGKWNGASWSTVGGGLSYYGFSIGVIGEPLVEEPTMIVGGPFFTAGTTPVFFAGKWNGAEWSAFSGNAPNDDIFAVAVFDDGSGGGPQIHIGGIFTQAPGVQLNRVAKWNGRAWEPLGSGLNNEVYALAVYDPPGPGGPALYAGGTFTHSGAVEARGIARWDGAAWSPVGLGMPGSWVRTLAVFNDGAGGGEQLYAGGGFVTAGGVGALRVARWNGAAWSAVGGGMDGDVYVLRVLTVGADPPQLFAGGAFFNASGQPAGKVARWNGTAWSKVTNSGLNDWVAALAAYDDGSGMGTQLYVGGGFLNAFGPPLFRVAKLGPTTWQALGTGCDKQVWSLETWDDGSGAGPALYVGGDFGMAGGVAINRLAKWTGSWSSAGLGLSATAVNTVRALLATTDPETSKPMLMAVGRWVGSNPGDSHLARRIGCFEFAGDVNGDGTVDGFDLALVLGAWGPCDDCAEDLNGDGVVNEIDIAIVLEEWTLPGVRITPRSA